MKILEFFKVRKPRQIYIYSILIGVLSGLGACLFSVILNTAEHFTFQVLAGIQIQHPPGETQFFSDVPYKNNHFLSRNPRLVLFFLPIIGGLLVGIVLKFLYSDANGAGTDRMIHAFHHQQGDIPGRGSFFKALCTIFTLSSGGSGGKEGPTAYIGASIGSKLGQFLQAGERAKRSLLLAGTAGGLGAIFRAPLGGALTAVEIVYKEDIESDSLVACLISSVSAYFTYTAILGPGTLFQVSGIGLQDYRELWIYVVLGLVCYASGSFYVKILHWIESLFQRLTISIVLKPALGGLCVSLIVLAVPEVLGTGMGYLHETINGRGSVYQNEGSGLLLAGLFFKLAICKILVTSFTVGSGGSGGLFAPSLFIGAMLGGMTAHFFQWLLPDWNISTSSFIIVGMGAFFSGVAHTPFSAMVMISDIIGSYVLLPPLMIVSMITFTLSSKWSLYRGQLENRFKSPAHDWDMKHDLLENMKISKFFAVFRDKAIVSKNMLLNDLEDLSIQIHASDFIVRQDDNTYYGTISLKKTRIKENLDLLQNLITIEDMATEGSETVTSNDSLASALQKITRNDLDKVAVIDEEHKIQGYILYQDIFTVYQQYLKKPSG